MEEGEERDGTRVAIVGAGLSGLSAAALLARQDGTSVEVFEANPHCGGQVASWRNDAGETVETGIHLAFPWYRNFVRLYREIGAPLRLRETDGRYRFCDGETGRVASVGGGSSPLATVRSLARFPGLDVSERWTLARIIWRVLQMSDSEAEARDGHSVEAFLSEMGASENLRNRLGTAAVTIQGLRPKEASAASFIKFLQHLYGVEKEFNTAFFDAPTGEALVEPLVSAVEEGGGRVHTDTPVEEVVIDGGRPGGLPRARGLELADGERATGFDDVVLAVPGHRVPGLLPEAVADLPPFAPLRGMTSAHVICLQLGYDARVLEDGNVRISNRRGVIFDGVCDKAHHWRGHEGGSVLQVLIDAARDVEHLSDEEITDRVLADLERFFPGCRPHEPRSWTVLRHTDIYCETRPGYWARVPRGPETPVEGLHLCGDYTDGPYHYGMESAVISGRRVARRILAQTGADELPGPPLPPRYPRWLGMGRTGRWGRA